MLLQRQFLIKIFSEIIICSTVLIVVVVFALMTAVRLGWLQPQSLPFFVVAPYADAAMWEQRNGRLYAQCDGGDWCFYCDSGYGLMANHHEAANGGNTNDSIWFSCAAGPW